jgi:hypothetical protein
METIMRRAIALVLVMSSIIIASGPARADSTEQELAELRARVKALEDARQAADTATRTAAAQAEADDADYHPAVIPFSYGDMTWAPGSYAPQKSVLKWGPFTGEVRADVSYHWEKSHPNDDTISGSSEVFRSNEFQVTQLGIGGDFYYKGAMARVMTQFGMYSQTTPRNDASPGRGQWNLADAYRDVSEAYGGYHFDVNSGLNVQAGIFMSYVGLWSYYNFDNWTYQPSYVSSNTPWFFNGMRVQWYPLPNLKIEPWLVNGWQAYGQFNHAPGVGLQVRWWDEDWLSILGNQYYGTDTLYTDRRRVHTDDSIMMRYYNDPEAFLDRMAFSFTFDAGCESGAGAHSNTQYFLGMMAYQRFWFYHNHFGLTFGGGAITNPGRYLVLLPPINGATAFSGTPYFSENPGDKFQAWDFQLTFDWMPIDNVTFRVEYCHRYASVPYFTGPGGVTPPGGNTGSAGSTVSGWAPDLLETENRITLALMVRF